MSPQAPLIPVNSIGDIPAFASDQEAIDFWQTHSLGPELLALMEPLHPQKEPPKEEFHLFGNRLRWATTVVKNFREEGRIHRSDSDNLEQMKRGEGQKP